LLGEFLPDFYQLIVLQKFLRVLSHLEEKEATYIYLINTLIKMMLLVLMFIMPWKKDISSKRSAFIFPIISCNNRISIPMHRIYILLHLLWTFVFSLISTPFLSIINSIFCIENIVKCIIFSFLFNSQHRIWFLRSCWKRCIRVLIT